MKKKSILVIALIILLGGMITMIFLSKGLKRNFDAEVKEGLQKYSVANPELLKESDIENLPQPVQKYLRYVGVIGKPKIWNMRAVFDGRMKQDENKGWMNINAVQYSFFKDPIRMFYISAKMFGLPVYGLHAYKDEKASMLIKAAGLVPVVNAKGTEMDEGETVTVFNDMCLLAPASLIDGRISWETIDPLTVKATFKNGKNIVSAELYFNEAGQMINFISYDRYMTVKGGYKKLKWSTPVKEYKRYGDYMLWTRASAIWQLEGREYEYADFELKQIEYNCTV